MCDDCGRHVTIVKDVMRCVLCGHRIGSPRRIKLHLRDWPGEIIDRHLARRRWWNEPVYKDGWFYY